MKKILYLIITVLVAFSCTEITDMNKNLKDPISVPGNNLFASAEKTMVDYMSDCNVNRNIWELFCQYWTEVTYTDESNYILDNRAIPDNFFRNCYRDVLKDLQESDRLIREEKLLYDSEKKPQTNRLAIIEIFTVYTYAALVECYGNIPYTEALDIKILSPKYDDGKTVYKALMTRLNTAIGQLDVDPEIGSFALGDNIYNGDVASWKKFALSLKLRMAMLFADTESDYAKTNVLEAVAGGVFSSNADNALYQYGSSQPNTNQYYVNLVASGRFDFVAAVTLVDPMNKMNDPRRPFYFSKIDGEYLGAEYGTGCTYESFSNQSDAIKEPTFPGNIFDYAQVEFLLAEAAARNFIDIGTAPDHYNKGVKASIMFWGATEAEADAYLAQPAVAYDATAWKEKIGTQAWIAKYPNGFDAWTTQRRLDVPELVAPPDAVSGFPVRFTYPVIEQTLNGDNYNAAAAAIGRDVVEQRLWWDVKDQDQ